MLNAQTYENQKTMLRIEAAQKELQSDMKTTESRLKALAAEQSWVREQAPSRSYTRNRTEIFTVTAYTLHPDECGKPVGSPGYGVTASGRKLTNADAFKGIWWGHDSVDQRDRSRLEVDPTENQLEPAWCKDGIQ